MATTRPRPAVSEVLDAHRAAAVPFTAAGVHSVVFDTGPDEAVPVVCLHGVPTSSFLYRRVLVELARLGVRGVAFDLPGLGLAGRPPDLDYTWTGLGRFARSAVHELGLERFHLLVHDIGGPVGFELAAAEPDRVASLTVLNTVAAVASFRRPWVMEPFAHDGVGRAWLAGMRPRVFAALMRRMGIHHQDAVSDAELEAYVHLLKGPDNGAAFLQIMRGFERTRAKERLYRGVLAADRPVQVLWGAHDPALPVATQGRRVAEAADVAVRLLDGRHFLQEDNARPIAEAVSRQVHT